MVSKKDLEDFRKIGDKVADKFVQHYFSNPNKKLDLDAHLKSLKQNKDWDAFLLAIPESVFFDQEISKIIPPSQKEIKQALKFYKGKESYILQLLGLLSLPYCYAAADGAKVLHLTERMYKDVHKRLLETAEFVSSIMKENAFEADGSAKVQIFKVRLMHAAARFYLQKGNWDSSLGCPVNQEDMAGTNLSFSLIVIRGLRKMGFAINYQDQMNYIKYWSWIGAMLGVNQNLLPQNGKEAREIDKKISERQFKSSLEGKELTQSLLNCFYQLNDGKTISNKEIPAFMRFLLGEEISNILALPMGAFPASKQLLLKLKSSIAF